MTLLAAILEGAVERELIPRNPARGRKRRVRERAPRRSYLETASQISALLGAAGELDREARADRQHLADVSTRHPDHPDDFVFATARGGRLRPDNFRPRVLRATIERANANLTTRELPPLPERITPHSLRRTFASILYAIGEDPGVVMDEMGHTDPGLALRVYRQAMRRGDSEKVALQMLVRGSPQ